MNKPIGPLLLLATSRKARWWVTVVIALPMLYVASFGPACWAVGSGTVAARPIARVYRPVLVCIRTRGVGRSLAVKYASLWEHDDPDFVVRRLLDAAKLVRVGTHRTNMMHDTPQKKVWISL